MFAGAGRGALIQVNRAWWRLQPPDMFDQRDGETPRQARLLPDDVCEPQQLRAEADAAAPRSGEVDLEAQLVADKEEADIAARLSKVRQIGDGQYSVQISLGLLAQRHRQAGVDEQDMAPR